MTDISPQDHTVATSSERLTAAVPTLVALPNVVVVGYPIDGRSRRAVRQQMNEQRPTVDGQRHDAATVWRYAVRWRGGENAACLPETAEVTVSITVTMPDLQDPERLSRADRAAWETNLRGLEIHEGNHARIANAGAGQIRLAMRAASSCEDMQAAFQRVAADVSAASQEYDRRTQHGATEGARF